MLWVETWTDYIHHEDSSCYGSGLYIQLLPGTHGAGLGPQVCTRVSAGPCSRHAASRTAKYLRTLPLCGVFTVPPSSSVSLRNAFSSRLPTVPIIANGITLFFTLR
jgi:hypothetical protein